MKYIKNIENRVRAAEKRAAVFYAKTDGKLYKWLKILYVISMLFATATSLLYVAARASRLQELNKLNIDILNSSDIEKVKTSIITVGLCSLVWVIAVILIRFKAEVVSALLTLCAGTVSCASLIAASQGTAQFNEGINDNFWYRHFVPLIIAVFFIIWMVILKLRAELLFRRAYTNMVNRIYEEYHCEDLSEEQWENFLSNYDPRAEEEKRKRKKKGISEFSSIIDE